MASRRARRPLQTAATPTAAVIPQPITEELDSSFLDYAMSVIVSRALPDVRDGLKPVHRRILVTLHDESLTPGRPYKKSAAVVGAALAKYHPHGDSSVYDAMVRLAQPHVMNAPLVDGQGNWGCLTGDTRVRLADGTTPTLAEMAAKGPDHTFWVYAVDETGRIVITEGRAARQTKAAAHVVEITLDHGEVVRATPDHLVLLRTGEWRPAADLQPGDSLMPGYFRLTPMGGQGRPYEQIHQPVDGSWTWTHHLADEANTARGIHPTVEEARWVRHHRDFNRLNNSPDNLVRMGWLAHCHLHMSVIADHWADPAFRERQRAGVLAYWATPGVRERHQQLRADRNRDPVEQAKMRAGREAWAATAEGQAVLQAQGKRLGRMARELWKDPTYRAKMSKALRGIEKRPLTLEQQTRVARIISAASRARWADPTLRQMMVDRLVASLADESVRQRMRDQSRRLWLDPDYRAKFPRQHFVKAAHALWAQDGVRDQHRAKMLEQWQDPAFREAHLRGRRADWEARQARDPECMQRMSQKAAVALRAAWADPAYATRVMRTKIAGHLHAVATTKGLPETITQDWFEAHRPGAWMPRFGKALSYFGGEPTQLREAALSHNHHVVAVRALETPEAVYDLTVPAHANFLLASGVFVHNSADGDSAAAYRYTEARMAPAAAALLSDLDKDTVDWAPTFDAARLEPTVLPAGLPNLLLNGNEGIAVGMATKIPPHNLRELVAAVGVLCDDPAADDSAVLNKIKGPDFPTAGLLVHSPEIRSWLRTGRGRFILRAKAQIETSATGRTQIVVTEVPYGVSPADVLNKIAGVYREGRGLAVLGGARLQDVLATTRNESSREGIRLVFELKKGADPGVVLQALYKVSDLQLAYSAQLLTLVGGTPRTIGVREALQHFLTHRVGVIVRRTQHDLAKAEARLHIVEGLLVAIDAIDLVVKLIRTAATREAAKAALIKRLKLTDIQTDAILAMRLAQLTALDVTDLKTEAGDLRRIIGQYRKLLASEKLQRDTVKQELETTAAQFPAERRTQIIKVDLDAEQEALKEAVPSLPTNSRAAKAASAEAGSAAPVAGLATAEETVTLLPTGQLALGARKPKGSQQQGVVTGTQPLWVLTSHARAIALTTAQLAPHQGTTRPLSAALVIPALERDERVLALETPLGEGESFVFIYANGLVKRITGEAIGTVRASGTSLASRQPEDEVVLARRVRDTADLLLVSREGQALRTPVAGIPAQGRASRGVAGMRLDGGDTDAVVWASVLTGEKGELVGVITALGLGRQTPATEFPSKGRGTGGVRLVDVTPKTGPVIWGGAIHGRQLLVDGGRGSVTLTPDQLVRGGRAVTPKPVEALGGEVQRVRPVLG